MSQMYNTKIFTDIFEEYNDFYYYYLHCGIPTTITSDGPANDSNLKTLYYLLYAKYGNSPIANYDENQWRYKVYSVIFMYGPTWEKKLNLQATLRNLTDAQIKTGIQSAITNTGTVGNSGSNTYTNLTSTDSGQDVHNHAYNPATEPSAQTTTELTYINEQHVDKFGKVNTMNGSIGNTNTQTNNLQTNEAITKGVLDGYSELLALLATDVTEDFLSKFGPLFQKAINIFPYLYESED